MKIHTLLLAAGLAAAFVPVTQASDTGLAPSIDICSDAAASGLTIAASDGCVTVTGKVTFSYSAGNYRAATADEAARQGKSATKPKSD